MTGYGLVFRGALYFAIAVLTPIAGVVAECATYGYWPSRVSVASATLSGIVAGLVAVRAFIDGSMGLYDKANGDESRTED
jgi:hypothetical protein